MPFLGLNGNPIIFVLCHPYSFWWWIILTEYFHLVWHWSKIWLQIPPSWFYLFHDHHDHGCHKTAVKYMACCFGLIFSKLMLSWYQICICLARVWWCSEHLFDSIVLHKMRFSLYQKKNASFIFFCFFLWCLYLYLSMLSS